MLNFPSVTGDHLGLWYLYRSISMTRHEFQHLMDKYLAGEATLSKEELIDYFFNIQCAAQKPGREQQVSVEMWTAVRKAIGSEKRDDPKEP